MSLAPDFKGIGLHRGRSTRVAGEHCGDVGIVCSL